MREDISCLNKYWMRCQQPMYVIQCIGCDEGFIGETGDILQHRMMVHREGAGVAVLDFELDQNARLYKR